MIRLIPAHLLNQVFNLFQKYLNKFIIDPHHECHKLIFNSKPIYINFNLNSSLNSSCSNMLILNINAGKDIQVIKNITPNTKPIIEEFYKGVIAHELLHAMQFMEPNKYMPYKKINDNNSHTLKDTEFYPNIVDYLFYLKLSNKSITDFISQSEAFNLMFNCDFNRYKKSIKTLYKESNAK